MNISNPALRSERLSASTDALHQHLHTLVAAAAPFASRENFGRFAQMQYRFQSEIEPLYRRGSLQALLPGLEARSRRKAVAADLADLGVALADVGSSQAVVSDHAALGWLFVSEGSTLGAAILLKRAEALGLSASFGARYLAPSAEGRARHWKAFVETIDGLPLTAEQDAEVLAGADAAFRRFAGLFSETFGLRAAA